MKPGLIFRLFLFIKEKFKWGDTVSSTHKMKQETRKPRGERMPKTQIEVVRNFASPNPGRDDKIIKDAAKAIADYIRRKKAK